MRDPKSTINHSWLLNMYIFVFGRVEPNLEGLLQKGLLSYWTKHLRLNLNHGIKIFYTSDTQSGPIQSGISIRNNVATVDVF